MKYFNTMLAESLYRLREKRTADDCVEFFGDIKNVAQLIRQFLYLLQMVPYPNLRAKVRNLSA